MQIAHAAPIEKPNGLCANCGAALAGPYCSRCGQSVESIERPAWELLQHLLESLFELDGRGPKTMALLLSRPGQLTLQYLAGKRARFVPPVRLYLFVSLFFFLAVWATGTAMVQFQTIGLPNSDTTVLAFKLFAPLEVNRQTAPVDTIKIAGASGETPDWVKRELTKIEGALGKPGEINDRLYELFPKMMFGMVPLFALALWGLYAHAGRFLIDHLVFALHFHSFAFLLGIALILIRPHLSGLVINSALILALTSYLLVAMKTVYRQGWALTLLKEIALLFIYYVVFAMSLLCLIVLGVGEA